MSKLTFSENDLKMACDVLKAKNKFSPGFDKMTPAAAETWLELNGKFLCNQLNNGKYKVMPAIGFNIAKKNGQYRRLAKLTAIDAIVQNAAIEKLNPECVKGFSPFSYAYQRGKSMEDAVRRFCEYGTDNHFVAKIDPKSCFDSIDFDILEESVSTFFHSKKTTRLLMSFARMPAIIEGQLSERQCGILQGAPISGMLCNIYLHNLDKLLEERKIPFLRYADDIIVFAKTIDEANQLNRFVTDYLLNSLRLRPIKQDRNNRSCRILSCSFIVLLPTFSV